MTATTMAGTMSPQLLEVRERAKRDPRRRFISLAHLIDEAALKRAYRRIRKDAAVGVDGVTKEQYGQDLERNARDLHERLRSKTLPAPAAPTCAHPEGQGQNATDWHLVRRGQGGPGGRSRSAGGRLRAGLSRRARTVSGPAAARIDALRALHRVLYQGEVNWILEADIVVLLRQR